MSTASKIVEVNSFSMVFDAHRVINDLSFEVNKGEVFGLLGANGAGKTTTIRTLLSLVQPTSGTLLINGKRYNPSMSAELGYLPEERGLYRNESVIDTMVYFGVLHGLRQDEAKSRALNYLKQVNLSEKCNEPLRSLSGGQQQKVQLGVTILHDPSLMILDEPTEALDPVNRSLLLSIINEHRDKGSTIILVTHRMEEVEQLCDRILLMKNGARELYGTIADVKAGFGKQHIALQFTGTLPKNDHLYTVSKRQPHEAELSWKKGVDVEEILRYLVKQPELHISSFTIQQLSLNDIFIETYQNQETDDKTR